MDDSYICNMDMDDLLEFDFLTEDDPPRRAAASGNGGCLTVLVVLIVCVSAYLLC